MKRNYKLTSYVNQDTIKRAKKAVLDDSRVSNVSELVQTLLEYYLLSRKVK